MLTGDRVLVEGVLDFASFAIIELANRDEHDFEKQPDYPGSDRKEQPMVHGSLKAKRKASFQGRPQSGIAVLKGYKN